MHLTDRGAGDGRELERGEEVRRGRSNRPFEFGDDRRVRNARRVVAQHRQFVLQRGRRHIRARREQLSEFHECWSELLECEAKLTREPE